MLDKSIQNFYAYSPYGETSALGDGEGNAIQYTARENDNTGLYFYRARYYDPVLKRFVSEDPMGIRAGVNRYGYVAGNPVSLSDPSGELPLPIITGIIGAVAGGIGNVIGQLAVGDCKPFNWTDFAVALGGGFVAGAVLPYMPGGVYGAALLGGVANLGQYGISATINGEALDPTAALLNFVTGLAGGALGGAAGRAVPFDMGGSAARTAASAEMVAASNAAANARLNTSSSSLARNLGGGAVGNASLNDLCQCRRR